MEKIGRQITGAVIATLLAAYPVQAQKPVPDDNIQEQAEKALTEGVQTILRAMETMFKSVPQYQMPEVLETATSSFAAKNRKIQLSQMTQDQPDGTRYPQDALNDRISLDPFILGSTNSALFPLY